MDERNEAFKQALRDANLPNFDFTAAHQALRAAAERPVSHLWRQRGPHLVCTSCPYEHSQWVGVDQILTGFDAKGQPILKPR